MTGIKGNTCSQSETPRAQSPSISISRAPLSSPQTSRHLHTRADASIRGVGADAVNPQLCGEAVRGKLCGSLRCKQSGLFVTD